MKIDRLLPCLLLSSALAVAPGLRAADADAPATEAASSSNDVSTIKFSDPSKPGTLKISIAHGDIRINGADRPDVSVRSEAKAETTQPRADGLRVLTASATYTLVEKNNVVTLNYGSMGWPGSGGDFNITVPRNTNIVISSSLGGDVRVREVSGDLEIKSLNGEVNLTDVSGGALVETMNGEIKVNVSRLTEGKPLSFTSMNGEVQLRIPADSKANVRLRTQNGTILTDFDDKQLVTKTTAVPGGPSAVRTSEISAVVHEAVRAGMEAAREATEAAREAMREAREAHREAREELGGDSDDVIPEIPVPPMAPLPPMTGGKMVTGTLNGGGLEIRITTMNGDVTLRKIDAKKS